MVKTLEQFQPAHPYLVCIDSDGCAFDVMEVKHKECFCPATVNAWNLQAVSRHAREAWEFVNLYSADRGINRFLALDKVLDLLEEMPDVMALTGFIMPDHESLKAWIRSGEPLHNQSLQRHQEDSQLKRTLEWSMDCNRRIEEMVRGVPPFPCVKESLEELAQKADIIIVSATSAEALAREWEEHQLISLVSAICGQETGSKEVCIRNAMQKYEPLHCLMVGDAPGDMKAAGKNGISFYPICPLHEAASWKEFYEKDLACFFNGTYAGEREQTVTELFYHMLPDVPGWKKAD